ncbi:hypothetical protein [Marinicella gelatinilytica]|uniref:hypothetical protein n=1 Tax=Marinicella gelatinilytica TaxID=2996017 RepID=UPI002260D5D2|nr:hypothetical protein [Marinicella gelatinilytica]MCX7545821.1 hypothetical protein [Marinicella gelatinilytica]
MKKIILLLMTLGFSPVYGHDFLTEILVYNDDYEANNYHIAVTFEFDEQDLLDTLDLQQAQFEMKTLTKRSGASNKAQEYKQVGKTICDFESDAIEKTCGVFDDFSKARSAAINKCDAYASLYSSQYKNGLIPQYIGPNTFTDGVSATQNHHTDYKLAHGLHFNCVGVKMKKATYSQELKKIAY